MFKTILQKAGTYSKIALRGSGPATLYFLSSACLAMLGVAALATYAYNIDKERWYKALAVLQGLELVEIQKAAEDRIADMSYEAVLEQRAKRLRKEEYQQAVTQQIAAFPPPPEEPKPESPPPEPSDAEKISAYDQRIKRDMDRVRTAGRDELTRLIEDKNMDVEQAKEVIRKFWKDGFKDLVLMTLLDMSDKRRGEILYAFRHDNPEELKDLNEILKDISDGKPMVNIFENASKGL